MDSGFYAAYSGLLARTEALDSAASNLANASTTGFRAEREYFRGAVTGDDSPDSQLGTALNSFSVLGGDRLNLEQGQLTATGNVLDLALEGAGFFAVETANGIRYTRDGAFERSSDGTLRTRAGAVVLNSAGKPVIVPQGEIAVGEDGAVSVDGAVTGIIGVFNLRADQLAPEGTDKYRNLGPTPKAAGTARMRQRYLESSNQDVIHGSLELVVVQRQAEMMQKALSTFQGTFDKIASEDLPKS